jgi:hypothetical protein
MQLTLATEVRAGPPDPLWMSTSLRHVLCREKRQ